MEHTWQHTKARLGGASAAAGPSEPRTDKKPRFTDGDFLDLEPAGTGTGTGTRILGQVPVTSLVLGLPADVVVTIFGLLDLKTLVMVIPSVRRQLQPQPKPLANPPGPRSPPAARLPLLQPRL